MKQKGGFAGFFNRTFHRIHPSYVSPDVLVYRAVLYKHWWTANDEPKMDMFFLREKEAEFSLVSRGDCGPDMCRAQMKECFGEVGLPSISFIKFGLRVKFDPVPASNDRPANLDHVSVQGFPPKDEAEARNLAFELLDLIVRSTRRKYKRKKIK